MTSDVFWQSLIYLPTRTCPKMSNLWGYFGPPTYPKIGRHLWTFPRLQKSEISEETLEHFKQMKPCQCHLQLHLNLPWKFWFECELLMNYTKFNSNRNRYIYFEGKEQDEKVLFCSKNQFETSERPSDTLLLCTVFESSMEVFVSM